MIMPEGSTDGPNPATKALEELLKQSDSPCSRKRERPGSMSAFDDLFDAVDDVDDESALNFPKIEWKFDDEDEEEEKDSTPKNSPPQPLNRPRTNATCHLGNKRMKSMPRMMDLCSLLAAE